MDRSLGGYRYILICQDLFSGFILAKACTEKSSNAVKMALKEWIATAFGGVAQLVKQKSEILVPLISVNLWCWYS